MPAASPVISSALLRRGHHFAALLPACRPPPQPRMMAYEADPHGAAATGRPEPPVNPTLKKVLDTIAYTVSGLVLAAGGYYGLQRLTKPAASPASNPPAPAAAMQQPVTPASQPAPPPPQAPPPDVPQPPRTPDADAAASAAEASAALQRDQSTFFALQKNCYDAAANNQYGEYPALQAAACNRYAQFANERGWDPGPLPAYGQQAAQPPAPVADSAEAPQPLVEAQPQVIILQQDFERDRQHGHHHDQPAAGTPPQRQIGPNYPLPHPQQPPPVAQAPPRPLHNSPLRTPGESR